MQAQNLLLINSIKHSSKKWHYFKSFFSVSTKGGNISLLYYEASIALTEKSYKSLKTKFQTNNFLYYWHESLKLLKNQTILQKRVIYQNQVDWLLHTLPAPQTLGSNPVMP